MNIPVWVWYLSIPAPWIFQFKYDAHLFLFYEYSRLIMMPTYLSIYKYSSSNMMVAYSCSMNIQWCPPILVLWILKFEYDAHLWRRWWNAGRSLGWWILPLSPLLLALPGEPVKIIFSLLVDQWDAILHIYRTNWSVTYYFADFTSYRHPLKLYWIHSKM